MMGAFVGFKEGKMTRVIVIGNNQVEMKSTATTAFRYKQIFGSDLKKDMVKLSNELNHKKENEENEEKGLDMLYMVMQLAYVMQCQAKDKIKTASIEDYYNWLDEYEEDDFQKEEVINNILYAWNKSLETTSKLKNQQSPQIER